MAGEWVYSHTSSLVCVCDIMICSDPDYKQYLKSVSPLVPWIPVLYRYTPYPLKLVFCCEFPFYQPSSQSEQDQEKGRSTGVVDQQQASSRDDETTPIKSQP